MHRSAFLQLLWLTVCVLVVSSCTPKPPPPQETPATAQGNTLTAAFAALPMSLAPHDQPGWLKTQVLVLVYEGLTALDKHLQPLPTLATSWEISADGLVYTLHLRQGVQFHHGKALDAADVRYSFQQAAQAAQDGRVSFAFIAAIHTPDPQTVRFVLHEPYAPFLTKLTVTDCPIVPNGAPSTAQAVPPGTGPFQVASFQPGQTVVLKKFAAYWEHGLPRLDAVVMRTVEPAALRLQLLQRGEIDYALLEPLYERATAAMDTNNVVLANSAPTGTFSVILQTRRQPLANTDVRHAFAWAIDKAALTREILGEYGVPVNQPFAPDTSPWHVGIADRRRDIDRARALLARAGYARGLSLSLPVIADAALFIKTALALQKQLQPVGIRLHVEVLPEASVQDRLRQGTWDLLLRAEPSPTDPDDVYFATLHASRIDSSNLSGYSLPAMDTLLNNARRTRDARQRRELYRQVVQQLQEDVPELYLFMARWPVAWRQQVQGYDRDLLRCCLVDTLTAIANQGFKTMWLAR
jgi:peptide/nickel transport system substrate-binding protein